MTTPIDPNQSVPFMSIALGLPGAKIMAWAQGDPPLPELADPTPGWAAHSGPLLDLLARFTGGEDIPALRSAVAAGDPAALNALEHVLRDARSMVEIALERAQKLFAAGEFRLVSDEGRDIGDLAAAVGNQAAAAAAYMYSARGFWRLPSATATVAMYERAIAAAGLCEPQPRALLSGCHDNMGVALRELGRLDEAVAHFRRSSELETDPDNVLQIRGNLALAYHDFGEYDLAARIHADNCTALQERNAPPLRIAVALDNWALALVDDGEVAQAIPLLERAAAQFPHDALDDRYRNAVSRRTVYQLAGERDKAAAAMAEAWDLALAQANRLDVDGYRQAYRKALKHYLPATSEVWQSFLAAAEAAQAQHWESAAQHFAATAQGAAQAGDRLTQLRCLANVAGILADVQQVDQSRDLAAQVRTAALQESLALPVALIAATMSSLLQSGAEEIDAGSGALALAAEGLVHADLHDRLVAESDLPADHPERRGSIDRGVLQARVAEAAKDAHATELAELFYRQAITSAQRVGYRYGEVNRKVGLLTVYDDAPDRAHDRDALAADLRRDLTDPALTRLAQLVARRALGARDDDERRALVDLRAGAEVLESMRTERPPGPSRSDLDREYGVYPALLRRLVNGGAPVEESFATLQAMRARRLMESLTAAGGDTAPYQPPSVAEIVQLLARQPRRTTFVDVVATETGLRAYLVDAAGLRAVDVAGDASGLSKGQWGDARKRAADVVALVSTSPLLGQLATAVTGALAAGSTMLLAVDDLLANLPLHAVPLGATSWGDQVSIGRIAAAGVLRFTPQSRPWAGRSLVAGDSNADLPGAAQECARISQLLDTPGLVGAACTVEAVRSGLTMQGGLDIVHLAVHGRADARRGGRSSLLFAGRPAQWVAFAELASLPWKAGLIVFSGCSTAVGGPRNGAGLYGVAQAAAEAGATTVIASLWPVEDSSAAVFMTAFYEEMTRRRTAGATLVDLREVMDHARAHLRAELAGTVAGHAAAGHAAAGGPARDGRELIIEATDLRPPADPDPALQWAPFVLLGEPTLAC